MVRMFTGRRMLKQFDFPTFKAFTKNKKHNSLYSKSDEVDKN